MSTPPHRSAPVTSTLAHHAADPFRLMVESVKDYAIYMLDPSGTVVSWNSGAERIKGYKSEEIIGRHCSVFYPAEEVAAGTHQASLQRALAEGRHEEVGQRLRKDGTRFWATVTTTPLFDHFNNHLGFAQVTQDISEKHRADLAMKESGERYRRMLDVMPDAMFVNLDGRIEYCNSTFAHLLGASRCEELLGRPVLSIFHPRFHEVITQRIETIQHHNGTVPLIEEEIIRLDGEAVPVEVTATATTHQGQPAILVVLRDLRQRKDVERRFHALIAEVKDYAIYTMDAQGVISTWNDGAARIFGYSAEETIGKHRGMLFSAEDVAAGAPQQEQDRAAAHGSTKEERWRVRKDGSRFWANGSMSVLRDSSGMVQGYVKVVRDLSERKQAEAAIRDSEERYRSLFQAISDPMFVYDRETLGYLAVNDAAVEKYGYSREEFLGMTIKDIRPQEDVTALLAMLATSGNKLEDRGIWRHQKKNGNIIEVEISAHGMIFSGRPACVIQARDVTEQRRTAAQAARTNELLQAVANGTPDSVFVKDQDGKYLLLNAAAAQSVGKPAEEVLGKDDTALYSPEDARMVMANDRLVMESDSSQTFENVLVAQGTSRTFEATKVPYRDASGQVLGVIGISRDVTQRKRAEEATRQSQALLRIAGRVARLGGWSLDLATRQVKWSDEICTIHEVPAGYQPTLEDAIRFYPSEYREQVAEIVERCALEGASFDLEMELITAKGRRIWVRSIGEAVRNHEGRIVGLQGAFQDISDRKRSEEEQRRLAERLIAAQAVAKMGSWETDLATLEVTWSDETFRIFEKDPASFQPTHSKFLQLVHPEDRAAVDRAFHESHSQHAPQSIEHRLRMPDGGIKFVEERWQVIFDEYDKPVRVLGTCQDSTDRKQAEVALRLRDQAIQEVSQGIVITDPKQPDNPIIYASAGVERITGYRSEEIVGRNCRIFQGKDTDRDQIQKLRQAITAGQSCAVEILNYRKDGTSFWNAMSVNPVRDSKGAISYFVGVQNDITDRKELESQLRQSQKMEAIGRLAGGVAHDFNNLLTIITGYSELLLARPDMAGDVRESIASISQAGERAAGLTRQLLGFSRQSLLQPKVLDLNGVITETGKMLRRLIGEDILFTTVLDPKLNPVKVDPGQLDQVLMNLAVNARDAMPTGGKLKIETANVLISEEFAATHVDLKAGRYVLLAMTDTGCGMPPDVLSRIFEPFYTTKEIGKGTGLGLAVVFGIVQQSGGAIHVESQPRVGTTFRVYLPAVYDPVNDAGTSDSKDSMAGTETVLLVEDEEGVRGLVRRCLQMHGYKVLTAKDGRDAWRV